MNYSDLSAMLGSNEIKRIDAHTCVEVDSTGCISVRFYDTRVVKHFPDGSCILNTGGYHNASTFKCMNNYLDLSTKVHSNNSLVICTINSIDYLHYDGMKIQPDGTTDAKPYIIHELNTKTDHRVSSMAEVIQLIEGSTLEALKKLWRKCRFSQPSIAYYAPLKFIPMILPTAKGNEPWYTIAQSRLSK